MLCDAAVWAHLPDKQAPRGWPGPDAPGGSATQRHSVLGAKGPRTAHGHTPCAQSTGAAWCPCSALRCLLDFWALSSFQNSAYLPPPYVLGLPKSRQKRRINQAEELWANLSDRATRPWRLRFKRLVAFHGQTFRPESRPACFVNKQKEGKGPSWICMNSFCPPQPRAGCMDVREYGKANRQVRAAPNKGWRKRGAREVSPRLAALPAPWVRGRRRHCVGEVDFLQQDKQPWEPRGPGGACENSLGPRRPCLGCR